MRAHGGERGAIAVVVAMSTLFIFGLAAMVVDLSAARDLRRLAQNASDASALAGAQALYNTGSAPLFADAIAAAKDYAAKNYDVPADAWSGCADSGKLAYTFPAGGTNCISFDSSSNPTRVRVVVPVKDVRTPFATVLGVDDISISALAEAGTRPGVGGLRPWGVCSKVVSTSGNVIFVPMKGGTVTTPPTPDCGSEGPPGGWWVAQCTDQGNGTGATEAAVLNGCPTNGYQAVPGQPTTTPAALSTYLRNYCPGKTANDTCLQSDPGNNFHNATEEWQTLVGQNIKLPVFCFPPTCTPGAFTAQGSNAAYAIHMVATVEICGFELQPRAASSGWPTTGPCATNNPLGYRSSDVTSGGGIFVVIKALDGGPGGSWGSAPSGDLNLTK